MSGEETSHGNTSHGDKVAAMITNHGKYYT